MGLTHIHHIIPKHEWKRRFGTLDGVDSSDNLVEITVEQHALAHKWLWEIYGCIEDKIAYQVLSGKIGKEELMLQLASLGGKTQKYRVLSSEHKRKIGLSNSKKRRTPEQNEVNRMRHLGKIPWNKGQKYTDEMKRNMFHHSWEVVTPEGEILTTDNLKNFCLLNRLSAGNMCEVAKGSRKHHKGYHCKKVI